MTTLPLTPARTAALVVGVPISLIVIIAAAVSSATSHHGTPGGTHPTARLDLSAQGTVTATANYGMLQVVPAAGRRLRLTWTVHYAHHHPIVAWHSTHSVGSGSARCIAVRDCTFSYQATLPAGLPTDLTDGAGTVTVHGLTSPVSVTTQAGDIVASAISGTVHLQAQAGSITGSGLSGALALAGDQAGDIRLTGLSSPEVTASGQSGNISLAFTAVPQRVSATDRMGDISIAVPSGPAAYFVSASTDFGTTHVGVPTSQGSSRVITASDQFGAISITH
ncbi:MAG TPA: DUF4097 family beta strand repeat-containing protein [Streptosporangiaceae bacterium]|nr:DUF4097 family beta strand repeat-containing protein [Streptosporangiaceae bacterium]